MSVRRIAVILVSVMAIGTATWWVAGDRIRSLWPRLIRPVSPHEQYARGLERANLGGTALGRDWLRAAATALQEPQHATAPFSAEGSFESATPDAIAWRFRIP